MAAHDERPVGVFDSGVGGLSVLRAIRDELPGESLIYVGDSAYAPYGDRSPDSVRQRSAVMTQFLIEQHAKAVVVACNTATTTAVESLRNGFTVPIVAIEPAIKPAALRTRSRVVGVLATTATSTSPGMTKLVAAYGRPRSEVEIIVQPCPGLANQVENGELATDATVAMVERYVRPLVDKGADTLVLGCTHYPFLREVIQRVAGVAVEILDPATAVARELGRRLDRAGLLASPTDAGSEQFWTTGAADERAAIVSQLWGSPVTLQRLER